MTSLILTCIIFIILSFIIPIVAKNLLHPFGELDKFKDKSLWYQFTHFLYRDVLKFITIGIPILMLMLVWLNYVGLHFGQKVLVTTLAVIVLGVGVIIRVKANRNK